MAAGSGIPGIPANSPLLNPNTTLSGNALVQAAKGLASAQVTPAIQQLAQEIQQQNAQTNNALNLTGGYFNQLGQQAQSGLTAEQGISSNLAAQLAGIQGNENTQLGQIGQNAQNSLLAHIPGNDMSSGGSGVVCVDFGDCTSARVGGAAAGHHELVWGAGGRERSDGRSVEPGKFRVSRAGDVEQHQQCWCEGNRAVDWEACDGERNIWRGCCYSAWEVAAAGNHESDLECWTWESRSRRFSSQTSTISAPRALRPRTISGLRRTSAANNQRTTAQSNVNNQRTTSTSAANNAATNAQSAARTALEYGTGGTKPLTTTQNNAYLNQLSEAEQLIKDGQQRACLKRRSKRTCRMVRTHPRKRLMPRRYRLRTSCWAGVTLRLGRLRRCISRVCAAAHITASRLWLLPLRSR